MELFAAVAPADAAALRERFPRVPMAFSGTITDPAIQPEQLLRPGMPRPLYERVPIPATAFAEPGMVNIIASDPDNWRAVLHERLCDLCNEPLASEQLMYAFGERDEDDTEWLLVRGCLHEHCYRATANWCVHIRERLLAGTMCACSLPYADSFDARVFEILDDRDHPVNEQMNVIAQYRVRESAVTPCWPYKLGRS